MPGSMKSLLERLGRYRQVKITVIGRKSGKKSSRPVWFVLQRTKLYLLPVQGSDTQWYKNVRRKPWIRIDAHGVGGEFKLRALAGPKAVAGVVEAFRKKYSAQNVKKYYSNFDVAVLIRLG